MEKWESHFKNRVLESLTEQKSDPAHDLGHYERVVASAKKLANEEISTGQSVQLNVVVAAAWLHDLANIAKNDPRRKQASKVSAEIAIRYLKEIGYPAEDYDKIAHAIEAHSYSAGIHAHTLEARIVQDADRLDALGAIGVARLFATSVVFGSAFYDPSDPFAKTNRPLNDQKFATDHFRVKLFKIGETLATPSGKREAESRIQFMHTYLDQLSSEISMTASF